MGSIDPVVILGTDRVKGTWMSIHSIAISPVTLKSLLNLPESPFL